MKSYGSLVLLHIWYVAITNEIVVNNITVDKSNYFWNICKIYNVLGLLSQVENDEKSDIDWDNT